jgi:hypothetical protein
MHSTISPNPCPGVGVARAIRARFPQTKLVALDDGGGSAASAMSDPVFDMALSVALMRSSTSQSIGSQQEKFETVVSLLRADKNAFFIPVRFLLYEQILMSVSSFLITFNVN